MLRWLLAAAAASAAVPAGACDTGPFRIHYETGSAWLSQGDRGLLGSMKAMAGEDGFIRLSGHTDTAGPAAANLRLAKRRVDGARDALIGLGMPPGRILTESFGESRSITALDDGRESRRHRFVLVELIPAGEARKGRAARASTTCGG